MFDAIAHGRKEYVRDLRAYKDHQAFDKFVDNNNCMCAVGVFLVLTRIKLKKFGINYVRELNLNTFELIKANDKKRMSFEEIADGIEKGDFDA